MNVEPYVIIRYYEETVMVDGEVYTEGAYNIGTYNLPMEYAAQLISTLAAPPRFVKHILSEVWYEKGYFKVIFMHKGHNDTTTYRYIFEGKYIMWRLCEDCDTHGFKRLGHDKPYLSIAGKGGIIEVAIPELRKREQIQQIVGDKELFGLVDI